MSRFCIVERRTTAKSEALGVTCQLPYSSRVARDIHDNCRDHRSLFPESRRPPPGLDSCVSGNGFFDLPPSSATTLEGVPADSAALLRFLGVSRPLLKDSGEFSSVLTFFHHQAGRWILANARCSKRAKRSKKAIHIPKFDFARLDHFVVELGDLERLCGELRALCWSNCIVARICE